MITTEARDGSWTAGTRPASRDAQFRTSDGNCGSTNSIAKLSPAREEGGVVPQSPRLNLTQVSTLRELVRRGTLAAAAQHLGYTPGAASQHLASLESTLGVALVERSGRHLVPTDAGRVIAEHREELTVLHMREPLTRQIVLISRADVAQRQPVRVFVEESERVVDELLRSAELLRTPGTGPRAQPRRPVRRRRREGKRDGYWRSTGPAQGLR